MTALALLGISLGALWLVWQILELIFTAIERWQSAPRREAMSPTEGTESSAR